MTLTLKDRPKAKVPDIADREAYYTICPVFVASHIAVEFGWLKEELARIGATLSYLRSLDHSVGWLPHYNHTFDHLFRDGGNIPSIASRADWKDTKLIGLTASNHGGAIVVRARSGIRRIGDLAGKRIGLYRSGRTDKVDWWRATGERGILQALQLAGLSRNDVTIVDVDAEEHPVGDAERPSDLWTKRIRTEVAFSPEVAALAEGRVDAVYASDGRALRLERTGQFAVIEDLSRYPDWTLQVANSPYAITVNADFADRHRDIIVAFLRSVVRAGRWANANRKAAATILARVTYHPTVEDIVAATETTDFVPNLSLQNLAGVDLQKQFLLDHGYVRNDFAIEDWTDPSYLAEAIATS